MYRLERNFPIDVDPLILWDFIATPRNLDQITPPDLEFKILSNVPETMYDGLLIEYEIKIPLFGRRRWLTEISEIKAGESFIDMQIKGPYRFWRHYHQLLPSGINASLMVDRIDYELPFGPLGAMAHSLVVENQLKAIFDYREKTLLQIFNLAE